MTPMQLDIMFAVPTAAGSTGMNGMNESVHAFIGDAIKWCKGDKRVGRVCELPLARCPTNVVRNQFVVEARKRGIDVLVMVDNDQAPDLYIAEGEPLIAGAKPFMQSSFDFLYQRRLGGLITVVGSPYCNAPGDPRVQDGGESVVVSRFVTCGEYGPGHCKIKMEKYPRDEAALKQGIQTVGALPTGLIMYDMRAFELIEPSDLSRRDLLRAFKKGEISLDECDRWMDPGWFRYEYVDHTASDLASTEDVQNTRDINLVCRATRGYDAVFCNWDAWAGHCKPRIVGKPLAQDMANIIPTLELAAMKRRSEADAAASIEAPETYAAAGIEGWMTEPELYFLAQCAARAKKCVEVGVWKGRSTAALAEFASGHVWAVDHFEGSPGERETDHAEAAHDRAALVAQAKSNLAPWLDKALTLVEADSLVAAEKLSQHAPFDFIFIDGGHDEASVRADIEAWLPLLADGGVLAGHDRDWSGVVAALDLLPGWKAGPGVIWYYVKEDA